MYAAVFMIIRKYAHLFSGGAGGRGGGVACMICDHSIQWAHTHTHTSAVVC